MTFLITDACTDLMDRTCVTVCPVDCIYEGSRMLYINPAECIDCGACEATCPNTAIFPAVAAPEGAEVFEEIATEWVNEHGAAGGAGVRGVVGIDHPAIEAIPVRDAQ